MKVRKLLAVIAALATAAWTLAGVSIAQAAPEPDPLFSARSLTAPNTRLLPNPSRMASDEPPIYRNGCHLWRSNYLPKRCRYGSGKQRVLLVGDSHGAHWFGALHTLALQHKFTLQSATKSSCPAVDARVRIYRTNRPHTSCSKWRPQLFKRLKNNSWGKFDVAVISSWHFHQILKGKKVLRGKARTNAWQAAMERTLRVLTKSAKQVVILRDSPQFRGGTHGFIRCVQRHAKNPKKCGRATRKTMSASTWNAERRAAKKFVNVTTVDLSTPYCGGSFCSPVKGKYLAFRDDNHFGHTFMKQEMFKSLRPHLLEALNPPR